MKKRMTMILCGVASLYMIAGCGGTAPVPVPAPATPERPIFMDAPPNSDPNFFLASAEAASPAPQMAIDMAELEGQRQLATRIAAVIENKMRTVRKQSGVGTDAALAAKSTAAAQRTVNQVLTGANIRQKKTVREGAGYRGYVLVEAPRSIVDKALYGSINQDDELRTRFMASKVFQDLDSRFGK